MVHYNVVPSCDQSAYDLCVECAGEELEKQARKLSNSDHEDAYHTRPCIICGVLVKCSVATDASTHWVCPACATQRIKEIEDRAMGFAMVPILSRERLSYLEELEAAAQAVLEARTQLYLHPYFLRPPDASVDAATYTALIDLLEKHLAEQTS